MKIAGIDSSGLVASVAIVEDENVIAEYSTNYKKTHSVTLLPMLDEITRMTEQDLSTIDAFAVAAGPGSFTGLRIGSATAKGMGLALDKPIVNVPTLEGLAYNLWGCDKLICPIMDARRGQVYCGMYKFEKKSAKYELVKIKDQDAMDMKDFLDLINERGEEVVFLGDGVPVFAELINTECRVAFSFAPAHMNKQRAASVAALGMVYFSQGKTVSAAEHAPIYLRKSQAQREREERLMAEGKTE